MRFNMREGSLPQVGQAADPSHGALQPQPKAGMGHTPVFPQINVPLVVLFRQVVLPDPLHNEIQIGYALAAADDLAVALGSQKVAA